MAGGNLDAYTIKVRQLAWAVIFFIVSLMAFRGLMFGSATNMKLLIVGVVAVAVVLALDKYYWVLLPVLYTSGISLPGLPFSGAELGCIILISVYFVRLALQREKPIRVNRYVLVAFPVFIWICGIWVSKPTGIAIFGSHTIGARFYLQIVFGFLTLLVLSSFRFTEKDCRLIFHILVLATIFASLRSITGSLALEGVDERLGRYEFLGALTLYTLMFSFYSLSDIIKSLWKLSLIAILAAMTIYSGKRRGFGSLAIVPILRTVLTNKDKMLLAVCMFIGAVLIFFAVAGDDVLWKMPISAKRALSVVVPQYQMSSAMGVNDIFREEVRRHGRQVMKENPWFGRRGFSMDRGETSWMIARQEMGQETISGHAYSGNWHNTWYAFACDFGLPAMFMWAFFVFFVAIWAYKGLRICGFGKYSSSVYIYYSLMLFTSLIFSYTSGHSSKSSLNTWIVWGTLLAIQNGARVREQAGSLEITA